MELFHFVMNGLGVVTNCCLLYILINYEVTLTRKE